MINDLDLVLSFDDTGSMSSVRRLVRNNINNLVDELFKHVPSVRIGIIIHNDYCDHDTIQYMDLTNDKNKIKSFVARDSSCGGGDSPECYELAINHFHEKFTWLSDKKICALIGDEIPHEKGYSSRGKYCMHDWKEELTKCAAKGLQIYAIQALNNSHATKFYQTVSSMTNGIKLELLQFQYILQYIMAIFHKENNTLEQYEDSQKEFKTNFSLKSMFDKLLNRTPSLTTVSADKDSIWKFQLMMIPDSISIKGFVEGNGLSYKAGKGYYQLTKTEEIQEKKEILMVKKDTDETITDTDKCRAMLGIGRIRQNFNPRSKPDLMKEYDIFVQSTSYNRKLVGGTKFLYELDYK